MRCIDCAYFDNLANETDTRKFGCCLAEDDHVVFNALEELEHCHYFKDKTELEKKQKEVKEKWEDDQNYAREIIEIMNTWRDRVNPIPLDFAIEAIKNSWRLK